MDPAGRIVAHTEYDELVVTRDIPDPAGVRTLLRFVGVAHVCYLPGDRIVGLSKLARAVELFAHGPQLQERLTRQIAVWLNTQLRPGAVGVVIEAEHLCMTMRGCPGGRRPQRHFHLSRTFARRRPRPGGVLRHGRRRFPLIARCHRVSRVHS